MKELQTAQGFADGGAPEGAGPQGEQKEIPTKKIVTALMTALEHKLGREPTPEELSQALSEKKQMQAEQEAQEQEDTESLPKLFQYKIYYGMKTDPAGQRLPDPEKPLFYENHDSSMWFDVDHGDWVPEKPALLDHLNCRTLGDSDNQKDIFDAIVYGVVDDEDFQQLSGKPGMLDPRCIRAYELQKKARDQHEQLQAMEKSVVEDLDQFGPDDGNLGPQTNNIQSMLGAAGLQGSEPVPNEEDPDAERAGGAQMDSALGPGIEPRIRRWIQEEIQNAIPMLMEKLVEMLESEGDGQPAPAEAQAPAPQQAPVLPGKK